MNKVTREKLVGELVSALEEAIEETVCNFFNARSEQISDSDVEQLVAAAREKLGFK